jgi:hypothetical protein
MAKQKKYFIGKTEYLNIFGSSLLKMILARDPKRCGGGGG